MAIQMDCYGCQTGNHDQHTNVLVGGLIGGTYCACTGNCAQRREDIVRALLGANPERAGREGDSQPLPTLNDAPDIQSQVIADIERRREVGIKRYGTALQPHNGRNALLDAYEEALDLAMYLKQRLVEDGA
jgi:hypothetical protein